VREDDRLHDASSFAQQRTSCEAFIFSMRGTWSHPKWVRQSAYVAATLCLSGLTVLHRWNWTVGEAAVRGVYGNYKLPVGLKEHEK
jgi:hypothetical protein